jgi:hypothetical protein
VSSAIEAEGLVKVFGKVRALDGIDMVAREGTVFGLLGPNGAGKTTAIRVLSTLLQPTEGQATVGGYDVVRQPREVRRLIGLTEGRGHGLSLGGMQQQASGAAVGRFGDSGVGGQAAHPAVAAGQGVKPSGEAGLNLHGVETGPGELDGDRTGVLFFAVAEAAHG